MSRCSKAILKYFQELAMVGRRRLCKPWSARRERHPRDAYAPQSIVVSDGVLTVEAWFGDGDIAAATTWSSLGSHVAKDERRDEDLELSDLKEEIPPELYELIVAGARQIGSESSRRPH
jgi:hypothetical protein